MIRIKDKTRIMIRKKRMIMRRENTFLLHGPQKRPGPIKAVQCNVDSDDFNLDEGDVKDKWRIKI